MKKDNNGYYSDDGSVSLYIHRPRKFYEFEPQSDITTHELAEIVEFLVQTLISQGWFDKLSPELQRHFTEAEAC